jgi:hypothetical protein
MTKTRRANWKIRLLMAKFWLMRWTRKAAKAVTILALIAIAYTAIFRTEYDKGICLNNEQDGMIYNADPYYNYISYRSTDARPGDEVFTVLILNPTNLACDDYIYRHDAIIKKH